MSAADAVKATATKVTSAMKMTAHPPVTVTLVAGAITNIALKVLGVTNPEIAAVLAGSEGDITIVIGALAGYLTGRAA
jgi:hypothetical protein